jgi:hypothetical protein
MKPGVKEDIINLLQDVCANMSDEDRDCIITWDEMSIKEFLQYDKNKDKLEGVEDFGEGQGEKSATEALTFMISGIKRSWSFPFSFYFSSSNTTSLRLQDLLFKNIEAVHKVGFRVRMGVCDMSFTNQGLYRKLGVSVKRPYITYEKRHDTSHLMKLIRNNLLSKSFTVNSGNEVKNSAIKWKYVNDFYKIDRNSTSRMAPKLSTAHMFVKNFSKMKVKLAVQVLSHSVAAGMRTMITLKQLPVEAKSKADFIKEIDRLFDILNISTDRDLKKKEKSGRHLIDNLHLLEKYFNYVESIHVVGKGR